MLQNQEFIHEFVDEAISHIENIESVLLKANGNSIAPDSINDIFRAVHSVKGTAGFFGLSNIVSLSHSMENALGDMRNGKLIATQDIIDLLLVSNDCLKSMVQDVTNSENIDISEYIYKLSSVLKGEPVKINSGNIILEGPEEKLLEISSTEKLLVEQGLKHGHKLYRVQLELNEHLGNANPILFFKKIESIGEIINSRTDTSKIKDLTDTMDSDICFTFLFSTVLEKNLLPMALNIPESCIAQLDMLEIMDTEEMLTGEHTNKLSTPPLTDSSPKGIESFLNLAVGHPLNVETKAKPFHEQSKDQILNKSQNIMAEDTIRVHVALLNSHLNLASEMVLGRNQLLRAIDKYRKEIPGIDTILQNIDRITTELQEKIMQTRMQPIGNVFNKFPRIIRDLSKRLGKEIDLQLEGVEVELDKSIIEALSDPLTHLIRNSADHGLEQPEVRETKGKPRIGTVTLKAYHEGGYVNIDIIDDGAGIDLERIKKKAFEKEIITKAELTSISEQEALQLLFKPGLSTAEEITDVSGRGVGMDVVRTNIEKLGGVIEIFTEKNKGTTFRLLLPLTLAIIPSLIVEVEDQKFALPQVNLQEIVRIKPKDLSRKIEYINDSEVLRLRGKLLPIVHLSDVLGLKRTYIDPVTGDRKEEKRKTFYDKRRNRDTYANDQVVDDIDRRRQNLSNILRILVLKIGSKRFGIAVDAIHGSEETLVKSLPTFLKSCKCYSGVTILGDGKAAMILDTEGIISKAGLRFVEGQNNSLEKELLEESENIREQQNLLLFKCSGPETFGIDLSMVSRVEEINSEDIEKIGEKEFIKFRNQSLRVIRPEDFLPVTRRNNSLQKMYVIIPKLVKHPIGMLIEKIDDTLQTSVKMNEEDLRSKGIIGSTILQNRIVLLINIYELFEKAEPEQYAYKSENVTAGRAILLAEDTPFFQKMEKIYLEMAGYTVYLAQNGKEAIQILKDKKVDAVVSDINMPVMDGLELVKRIREDKMLSGLPVIAVTSMTGELQQKAGLDAGFDFYEFKLDKPRLLTKIEQAIEKRRAAI